MEMKSKQRLVGLLILLAILAIFLPLLFHNSNPSTQSQLSVKIPPKPKMDQMPSQIQEKTQSEPVAQEAASAAKPGKSEPAVHPAVKQSEPKLQHHSVSHPVKHPVTKTKTQPAPMTKEQLRKAKAVTTSEQKGLKAFMSQPKAWAVQLGTFHNVENAKRLISKLRKKGFDAYTRPVTDVKGNRLIRVYVGPEIRHESALQLRNKLRAAFHVQGVVRKYKIKT